MYCNRLLTGITCLVMSVLACSNVRADDVFDQNRNLNAILETIFLGIQRDGWSTAARNWDDRKEAVGYLGPLVRGKKPAKTDGCPKVMGKEDTVINYRDEYSLTAVLNKIEECHKNEENQKFDSYTMSDVVKTLKAYKKNRLKTSIREKWRTSSPEKNPDKITKEDIELTFPKMADVVAFRKYYQDFLSIVPKEMQWNQFIDALEERKMASRILVQDIASFNFGVSIVNHALTAENDDRYNRGVQQLDHVHNLREEVQALNAITIGSLFESARLLNMRSLDLAKRSIDNLFRKGMASHKKMFVNSGNKQ